MTSLNYDVPGAELGSFMRSDAFVRGIRGPYGSGKSVAAAIELFRRALGQKPGPDGIRRTRMSVVRQTGPELRTTTIKTWLDWFPEHEYGRFSWSPPFTHNIKIGDIECEVIFLALDREEDVKKLLSLELTMVWINEAREIVKPVIDACTARVGRYPSKRDGGATFYGIIMDTNSMEPEHWWPIMSGEAPMPEEMDEEEALTLLKPDNWKFFTQPPAVLEVRDEHRKLTGYEINQDAENLGNLIDGYYENQMRGKGRDYIECYLMNRLRIVKAGKVVYPTYNDHTHCAGEPLTPFAGQPILIGLDFGLTPAAVFTQRVNGRWLVLRELCAKDMGAARFAEQLKFVMARHFGGFEFTIWGDPAGDQRAQTDETTPFEILRSNGVTAHPASSNDWVQRSESVAAGLDRMIDGGPGFLLDPGCSVIRAGFQHGYHYPKINASGGQRVSDRPAKNRYSHPHDALQYVMMSAGEGAALTRRAKRHAPAVSRARTRWNVLDRAKSSRLARF